MKSEWYSSTIGDSCLLVTDGSHSSPKSVAKGKFMVSVKDFTQYGFDFANCKQISDEDYAILVKGGCIPQKDDILIGKDGARFFEDIIIYRQDETPALLSSIAILRCDTSKIIPDFLYYILKTPTFKQDVRDNYGSGSAIPRIILKDFKRMPIRYPSTVSQQNIVAILSSLDDKIELNQKINENLERQLHALYMKIFAESAMDAALGDVVVTTSGGTPSRKHSEYYDYGNIGWVKSKELLGGYLHDTEEHINELAVAKSSAKLLPTRSVLIAMYGATVGAYGIISKPMACNQAICALLCNEKYPYTYLFQVACESQKKLINLAVGSAQQNISQILIKQLPVHSDENIIRRFHLLACPIHEKIEILQAENRQLSEIRDTLLPKLMAGEIDLQEV